MFSLPKLSLLAAVTVVAGGDAVHAIKARSIAPVCPDPASLLSLSDPPYSNYFYSDCNVAAQAVITSPLPDSDLSIIGPRLIVAWPAGNSGVCAFFEPQNGVNGSLAIELVNSTDEQPLNPVYDAPAKGNEYPNVGIEGILRFNSSAALTIPILGSIRMIRDFTEGPSLLYPEIQDAVNLTSNSDGSATLNRVWLDNVTSIKLTFAPSGTNSKVAISNKTLTFTAGDYHFSAKMNYPQLSQLKPSAVLNNASTDLTTKMLDQTNALSFLSYSEKLLAGAWRFLTYFGRDSMISALLLEPVLSYGNGSSMEAVIGSVLERVNRTDGSVCHEETIGDYATYTNLQQNISSSAMICDYKMIDSDYYLPILMERYFVENAVGQNRVAAFFNQSSGINEANRNLTWGQLADINAERIIRLAAPFARDQRKENLIHLKEGQIVGEWRDSEYGIGGGRIPFDVNTALVPAALRSIATLTRHGIYSKRKNWARVADAYAQIWEDKTLSFFEIIVPQEKAQSLVESYANSSFAGPSQSNSIDTNVVYHAVALEGNNKQTKVEIMNTDDCFRHFLLNTTNDAQLTSFLNNSATNVRRTFPAGLMTSAGMVVANPAFGEDPVYAQNFTTGAYHGTVIWSWPLAMMAKGLERQLGRCEVTSNVSIPSRSKQRAGYVPAFCTDDSVYKNVRMAYNVLWDNIEKNQNQLSQEVWSWVWKENDFKVTPLGVIPPPGGGSQTESDIRQLWSLAFLAVTRNRHYQ